MAGMKGRSGGPRRNAGGPRKNAGGARSGAGRKPNPPVLVRSRALQTIEDPEEWLREAMQDESVPMEYRLKIAAARRRMTVMDAMAQSAPAGNVTAMITFLEGSAHTRTTRKP